jgi:dTMP kinase
MFIVFEGIVGTGKSTQAERLYRYLREKHPEREIVETREPGGTEVAEAIRKLVQGTKFKEEMEPMCEVYLYAASRAQSTRKVVKPVLERGGIVIGDRSFITALAIHGYVKGVGVETVLDVNRAALDHVFPDLVLFMDMPVKMGLQRTFDDAGDRWESLGEDFFRKVAAGYEKASKLPVLDERWVNIDARGSKNDVFERIVSAVDSHYSNS